jgi:hypothetical protein
MSAHPGLLLSELISVPSGQTHRPDAGITGPGGHLRPCPVCTRLWNGPRLQYREDTGQVVATDRDPSVCPRCQPPSPTRAVQP